MNSELSRDQTKSISRISSLVLANALIFHEILSENNAKVKTLQGILECENIQGEFCKHWEFIIGKIDYYPIFYVAREILLNLSSGKELTDSLRSLAGTAQEIVGMRAALRHDLMGRIYHRLLVERKYLGTYYTKIPAASLLLKLALRSSAFGINWNNLKEIEELRIVDLACGTGTLLMTAADSITDNYVSAAAARNEEIEAGALHKVLVEKVIYGYDVLASAIHLTASTMALRASEVTFERMNLFSLPLGGIENRLGSIEYILDRGVGINYDLFGAKTTTKRVKSKSLEELNIAPLPDMDLCVMNPPFARSVGGNLLFGSLPGPERKRAQQRLKKLVQAKNCPASITAGLGSVFVAAASPYIKNKGRIALVLPKGLLSGVAWKRTRELISDNYKLEYLVVSHEPGYWNFSESTSLSEVLLVAEKTSGDKNNLDDQIIAVNLWKNPRTSFEAQAIGQMLANNEPPDIASGQGSLRLEIEKENYGEAIALKKSALGEGKEWILPCSFAQSDLIRSVFHLASGVLWLPGQGEVNRVPLCVLHDVASIGPDRRDIYDGFALSESETSYPAFWGHSADSNFTFYESPNTYLTPLSKPRTGRQLRRVEDLWPKAGRILIAERMRLNTLRLVAMRCSKEVLANVWWPVSINSSCHLKQHEKALVLWLNSTLGLLLLLAHREETEGAWISLKKPMLAKMPIIDFSKLSSEQLAALEITFDELSSVPLKPLSEMALDDARAHIDERIANVLRLDNFSVLREMLSREPIITLRKL